MKMRQLFRKLNQLILAFLLLFPCISRAESSPPVPPVTFPFDLSKQDSTVNQEFRIREYRSYYIALRFDHSGGDDAKHLLPLVGEGGRSPDGSYVYPGIIIPIRLKVIRLEAGKDPETIDDETVETKSFYSAVTGALFREIIAINLKPGVYRLEASTVKDSLEFAGRSFGLVIEPDTQMKFLPDSK